MPGALESEHLTKPWCPRVIAFWWKIFVFRTAVSLVQLLITLHIEPSRKIIYLFIKCLMILGGWGYNRKTTESLAKWRSHSDGQAVKYTGHCTAKWPALECPEWSLLAQVHLACHCRIKKALGFHHAMCSPDSHVAWKFPIERMLKFNLYSRMTVEPYG